jgi:uncharacterized protein YdhG (YjbR/CyaY superfamily)
VSVRAGIVRPSLKGGDMRKTNPDERGRKGVGDERGVEAVEKYLAAVPEPGRSTLQALRKTIRSAAPPGTEEVISYGMPGFRYQGGLVVYAAFKKHCSLFPMSSLVFRRLAEELEPYKSSTGTLQFPLDEPLPAALVKRIVKTRVEENEARVAARAAKKAAKRKRSASRP